MAITSPLNIVLRTGAILLPRQRYRAEAPVWAPHTFFAFVGDWATYVGLLAVWSFTDGVLNVRDVAADVSAELTRTEWRILAAAIAVVAVGTVVTAVIL